ncbi:hypothetical protein AMTR_s00085p00076310 [Amborella trichopoda]|uniref:Uncharacterized protein n=1 Tax=Amborella trichopoda TaxID=13333 RepID=W1P6T0_AMBTC|nr:hypothetical protein AMTR_s00085p00076310 [Amborella trichopoda]
MLFKSSSGISYGITIYAVQKLYISLHMFGIPYGITIYTVQNSTPLRLPIYGIAIYAVQKPLHLEFPTFGIAIYVVQKLYISLRTSGIPGIPYVWNRDLCCSKALRFPTSGIAIYAV